MGGPVGPKRGNKNYYKGKGGVNVGTHTSKGAPVACTDTLNPSACRRLQNGQDQDPGYRGAPNRDAAELTGAHRTIVPHAHTICG